MAMYSFSLKEGHWLQESRLCARGLKKTWSGCVLLINSASAGVIFFCRLLGAGSSISQGMKSHEASAARQKVRIKGKSMALLFFFGVFTAFLFRAVNASNDCLTGGKASLQLFGGKDLGQILIGHFKCEML